MDETKKRHFCDRIEMAVIVVMFTVMVIVTAFTVFSRYFFHFTFSWAEQFTRVLFVWVSFAGISLAGKLNAHMRVSALTIFMGEKKGKLLLLAGDFIAVIVGLYLAYKIATVMLLTIQRKQFFSAIPWCPVWVMYLGGVLGMLGFVCRVIQGRLKILKTTNPETEEKLC
jgi:TRAP-type C4-dicarboxylate transport system permease small subunit